MRGFGTTAGTVIRVTMALAVLGFAGCASTPAPVDGVDDVPVFDPDPHTPEVTPQPDPRVPVAPRKPPIAIVLTSSQPAYQDVAVELADYFEDHSVYDLSSESLPPVAILRSINDTASSAVVAVGLRAAQSSVAMADVPVVFSQVFNHQDHGLVTDRSRGVAALPPLDGQLSAWKQLSPELSSIGVIIGEGHDDLIADAEIAAARHGVALHVRIARSDQETLYFFRRMIRDIDGFWLFPDNRILSKRVLDQMLEEANRQRVPVAVPNEAMLQMGAAISMSTVAADIARVIAGVVEQIQAGAIDDVPSISPLTEVRVRTHD